MFYVRGKKGQRIILEDGADGNIFSDCPSCGKAHRVDLKAILSTGDCDLYSTQSYCPECAGRLRRMAGIQQEHPRRTKREVVAYEEGRADAMDTVVEKLRALEMTLC